MITSVIKSHPQADDSSPCGECTRCPGVDVRRCGIAVNYITGERYKEPAGPRIQEMPSLSGQVMCVWCGMVIEHVRGPKQKYHPECSTPARNAANNARQKEERAKKVRSHQPKWSKPRECIVCGAVIEPETTTTGRWRRNTHCKRCSNE